MGTNGGTRYPFPTWVWSPAGGWWSEPKHWKRNTFVAGCLCLILSSGVFYVSAQKEVIHKSEEIERFQLLSDISVF